MSGIFRILKQKYNPPQPTSEPFAGKTIIITGGTSGLGLAAAKHIVELNADKLIITCRNAARGEHAKQVIEASKMTQTGKKASSTEVYVMEVDMNGFDSVKAFAQEVSSKFPRIDAVILNSGTHKLKYVRSVDGWEEDIQVNSVATTLLGLLLLPKLLESARTGASPTHLTFVSSGLATVQKAASYRKYYDSPNALREMSSEKSWHGGMAQYGLSKLLLEYSMRHIAPLPALQSDDGTPKVVVNSTCPGMCKSDLGRDMVTNWVWRIMAWIIFALVARSAEQGSNSYVSAITRDGSSQGQLWKDDNYYDAKYMITSEEGKKFGDKIWKEMVGVVGDAAPEVKGLLAGK